MGWFTCNPIFAERFERVGETTCQRPSGFTQAMIGQLLVKQWGMDKWVRWLHGLQAQYTARRDAIVDALLEQFDHSLGYSDGSYFVQGLPLYTCFPHPKLVRNISQGKQIGRLCSFHPPSSGMFVWVTQCLSTHKQYLIFVLPRLRSTLTLCHLLCRIQQTLMLRLSMSSSSGFDSSKPGSWSAPVTFSPPQKQSLRKTKVIIALHTLWDR
jgi:hypothetical protein